MEVVFLKNCLPFKKIAESAFNEESLLEALPCSNRTRIRSEQFLNKELIKSRV